MTNRSPLGRIAVVLAPTMLLVLVLAVGGAESDPNTDLFSPLYQLYEYIQDYFHEPERIADNQALYGAMKGLVQ